MTRVMNTYALPRQIFPQEIKPIAQREVERIYIQLDRLSSKKIQELQEACQTIEKEGLPKSFVLAPLPDGIGKGLFLHPKASPLEKGKVIAPYAGVVSIQKEYATEPDDSSYAFAMLFKMLLTKSEQQLWDPKSRFHPKRHYMLNLDAEKKGNFTRYINHSEEPNVEAYLYEIPKNKYGLEPMPIEVIYQVKKKILPCEQLMVSYEDETKSYWNAIGIKPRPIHPRTYMIDEKLKVYQT